MHRDTDEQTLVGRAERGDEEAWDALVHRYRGRLTGFCGRFLRNEQDREDAVQDTLARVWRHLGAFGHRAGFSTWLYSIATNVCLDILAERRKIPRESLEDPENPGLVEPPDPGPSPEQLAIWRQMFSAVPAKAMARKPPWDDTDQIIYYLHCLQAKSFREIGESLHIKESAAKNRYYRKIDPVLEEVKQEFGED